MRSVPVGLSRWLLTASLPPPNSDRAAAEPSLKPRHGMAQRRGRHAEFHRRGAEIPAPGDGDHGIELDQSGFVHCPDFHIISCGLIPLISAILLTYIRRGQYRQR